MRTSLLYVKTIFLGQKYLLISIPVFALVAFVGLFYLTNEQTITLIDALTESSAVNYDLAIQLSQRKFFRESFVLVFILPLIHLLFFQKLFYKPYEFTLPIGPGARYLSYMLVGLIIFLSNLLILILFNYILQVYLQTQFLSVCQEAYNKLGYLYESIPNTSILHNGNVSTELIKFGSLFILLLPVCYIVQLYFHKNSILKFTAIIATSIIVGRFYSRHVWANYNGYINNEEYIQTYPFVLITCAAILCFIGFYYLLKDKEV